jgi:hypothetical protein
MKRHVLMGVLLVGMFACPVALSKEVVPEDADAQMARQERQMELQQRQAQMDMERERQKLDLEGQRLKIEREREGRKSEAAPLLLVLLVVNILVAIWVYMDIRQLNRGSGIWIVITLLTGLLGALVYAVVRLGDGRPGKS